MEFDDLLVAFVREHLRSRRLRLSLNRQSVVQTLYTHERCHVRSQSCTHSVSHQDTVQGYSGHAYHGTRWHKMTQARDWGAVCIFARVGGGARC